jgi:hypothetical protein
MTMFLSGRLRRLLIPLVALFAVAFAAQPASATIHPLVASFCAQVASSNPRILDPPGQTPVSENPNEWDVSDLRALQATGVLTLVRDANGNVIGFVIDESLPAVKSGSFPAFSRCPALNP